MGCCISSPEVKESSLSSVLDKPKFVPLGKVKDNTTMHSEEGVPPEPPRGNDFFNRR